MASGALVFRLIALSTIFLAGLSGAALPFLISARHPRLLGLLNAAAAGVFLAAALVHLLDDAEQNPGLQRWSTMDDGLYKFPWAPAFCLGGFLLLLLVGELARALAGSAPDWSAAAALLAHSHADAGRSDEAGGVQSTNRPRRGSNHGEPLSHGDLKYLEDYGAGASAGLTAVVRLY